LFPKTNAGMKKSWESFPFLLISFIFCSFFNANFAQTSWERTYNNLSIETQARVIELNGQLYVVSLQGKQAVIKKIEKNSGSLLWIKKWVYQEPIQNFCVQASLSDNSIVLAAETKKGDVASSLLVIKINSAGGYAWLRKLDLLSFAYLGKNGLFVSGAGDIFLCGVATNLGLENDYDSFIIKLNNRGQTVFHKIYPVNFGDYDFAHSIIELPNRNIAIVGETIGFQKDGFILWTDRNGTFLQLKVYDPTFSYDDSIEKIQLVDNNLLAISGTLDNAPFIANIDFSGNPVNSLSSPLVMLTPPNFTGAQFIVEPNKAIWLGGTLNNNYFLSKITASGNLDFAFTFGGALADSLFSLALTDDFIYLAGTTANFGALAPNAYLVKLSRSNINSCNQSVSALNFNNLFYEQPVDLPIAPSPNTRLLNVPLLIDVLDEPSTIGYPCCVPYSIQIRLTNNCIGQKAIFNVANPAPNKRYLWDIGNDNWIEQDSFVAVFSYFFDSPGFYPVKVIAWDTLTGCKDSVLENYFIAGSKVIVSAQALHQMCDNDPGVRLQVNATLLQGNPCVYVWAPAAGLSASNVLTPLARPNQTTVYTLFVICQGCTSAIDSVKVIVHSSPRASISAPKTRFCVGSGGVWLQAVVNGGAPPYSYQWLPRQGLVTPFNSDTRANPAQTTTYSLTVTDRNGCGSLPADMLITVDSLPKASAGPDLQLCKGSNAGGFLRPRLNPEYDYFWSPSKGLSDSNAVSPFASPDTTTIYTLLLRDRNTGCKSVLTTLDTAATVTVFIRNTPIASVGNKFRSICLGDSIQVGNYPRNGGPEYTFEWTPSLGLSDSRINFPIASPPQSTFYYFRVSSNGCTSMADTLFIQVNGLPRVAVEKNFIAICPKDSALLVANVAGGEAPYSYQWSPASFINASSERAVKVSPPQTLTYKVSVTDKNGCQGKIQDSVVVSVKPLPELIINPGNKQYVYCAANDSLQFEPRVSGNPMLYRYSWSPAGGLSNPGIRNPKVLPPASQYYRLTVTFGDCEVKDSIFTLLGPQITAKILAEQDTICENQRLRLSAWGDIGAGLFRWRVEEGRTVFYRNQREIEIFPSTSSTYYLEVREGECVARDTFRVFVKPLGYARFEYTRPKSCDDLSITVINRSRNARHYLWAVEGSDIKNDYEPVFTFQDTGSYRIALTVYNDSACIQDSVFTQTVRIAYPVKANFTSYPAAGDTLYLPNASVAFRDSSNFANSWFWQFGDGSVAEQKNPTHRFQKSGEYYVKLIVTDPNNCKDEKILGPYIVKEPSIFIPNVFTPNQDGVNDFWEITYEGQEDYSYQVFDRFGKLVYQGRKGEPFWEGENMMSGTYYYILNLGKKRIDGVVTLLR
jgi:gliding motility-associated-like protein